MQWRQNLKREGTRRTYPTFSIFAKIDIFIIHVNGTIIFQRHVNGESHSSPKTVKYS